MNKFLFSLFAACLMLPISITAQTAFSQSQCDPNTSSYIQCGYYDEGYKDGANDAQNNRSNDYKRYKDKIDGKRYEDSYRRGYDAGYNSIRPFSRWDTAQRSTYDQGYRDGDSDRRKNISRLPERYEGQYNRSYEQYYRAGYFDGYDNKTKQYDRPIDTYASGIPDNTQVNPPINTTVPGLWGSSAGTETGSISWSGRVDDRVNIIIKGNSVQNQILSGTFTEGFQNMNGTLPRRPVTLSVNKIDGRGSATVIQQPTRSNNYIAIVQVADTKRGNDNYRLDISWSSIGANIEEQYQAGKVTWSGRVDQTANIVISGSEVRSEDASATGLRDVKFNISGYLARRPGTVTANKTKGRGSVVVLQQPSYENDYTAVVRVIDTDKGEGEYQVEISW